MATDPTERARKRMVSRQIAARGITHKRTLAAMARVPRHLFVPSSLTGSAYDDSPLPVGLSQTISQPYMVALMTAALEPHRTFRVLEIGTGSGYQTAVLAHLVRRVYSVERLPDLARNAEQLLRFLGFDNVEFRVGDGSLGWSEAAPFEGIVVTAATPELPPPLVEQLAEGGRIVAPVGGRELQELVIGLKRGTTVETRKAGGCRFVPLVGRHAFPEYG